MSIKRKAEERSTGKVKKPRAASKDENAAEKPQPDFASTLLKDEGKSFPRGGGGSSLDPTEVKQIQLKATRDALLEVSKGAKAKSQKKAPADTTNAAPEVPQQPRTAARDPAEHAQYRKQKAERRAVADALSLKDLTPGMLTAGRVTKVEDYAVFIQLGTEVAGRIGLTELADDFKKADPHQHTKHENLRVCVLEVDVPNKKTVLSTRPSKILSSTLPVRDPIISKISDLRQDQLVRGFVKNVAEIGLFVSLSHSVTAFVRVPELSDDFVDDWRSSFQIDQLVSGRIVALDETSRRVQMSLKASVVAEGYRRPLSFTDISEGDVVEGKIRKVEGFGVFIVVDNSENVSGLCHRSEMAEARVDNVHALYSEGDRVKAKVLNVDPEKRKISFGLKTSYFRAGSEESEVSADSNEERHTANESHEVNGGVSVDVRAGAAEISSQSADSDTSDGGFDSDDTSEGHRASAEAALGSNDGLDAGGFDWNPEVGKTKKLTITEAMVGANDEPGKKKKKSHKPKILEDHTGDLDDHGPQTSDDYERLLLGQRDDAQLWVQYMAYHLNQQDVNAARAVAERALREIGITRQAEKLDVWTALLNLELKMGTEEQVEEVFKRACEVTDRRELHERMANCYIGAGWFAKADEIFTAMTKHRDWTVSSDFWTTYAAFLFNNINDQARARALLQRAMQSVYSHRHPQLLLSFAQLEFKCRGGDPERGRTMFEGLIDTYPKHWDYWDIFIATEKARAANDNVRNLFERMTSKNAPRMKRHRANKVFKAWLEFEESMKDVKRAKRVKAREQDYKERFVAKE